MFRKGPASSLPASVRFWLDNFLFFAATSAADEGWIYFASVAVRNFTKTTTIWVRIIHSFTYFISSDKHFLWSIFCTRTLSGIFHVACGLQNISWLVRPQWYFIPACWEKGIVIHCVWCWGVSCNETKACIESNVKELVAQAFPHKSPPYALNNA